MLICKKCIVWCYEDGHIKRTLSYAVEELNIKEDEQFHRAICDAEYTAKVMKARILIK